MNLFNKNILSETMETMEIILNCWKQLMKKKKLKEKRIEKEHVNRVVEQQRIWDVGVYVLISLLNHKK